MNIGAYAKTIVTIIAAGAGVLVAALSDNVVTPVEYVNIAIAIATAIGVYLIPNLPAGPARYGKTFVALAGAALTALATVVAHATSFSEVSQSDWIAIFLAGLGAIGLFVIPNKPPISTVITVAPDAPVVKEAFAQVKKI